MKKKQKAPSKPRDLVAKDLLTNGLYRQKIHKNRKKEQRNAHPSDDGCFCL